MKFRRKSEPAAPVEETTSSPEAAEPSSEASAPEEAPARPRDSSEVADDVERVDLGSLRIPPMEDREVRLQVDEKSETVQAVLIVGPDGALDVRAFAAPRNGALWDEARPEIIDEATKAGGTAEERDGRFGVELMCTRPATTPDGTPAVQPSRVVGADGDRWMLRGTFVGRPAMEPDNATDWDDTFAAVVVHRGAEAMAAGEALPVELPSQARRVD